MASLLEKSPTTKGNDTNGSISSASVMNDKIHHKDLQFSSILREKISNKDKTQLLVDNEENSWLYDVDIFREKLKNQHFNTASNISCHNGNGFYNNSQNFSYLQHNKIEQEYSDSCYQRPVEKTLNLNYENKFQTRSESEPNNISELRFSPSTIKISNNLINEHRSNASKKLPPTPLQQYRIRGAAQDYSLNQNQINNKNDNKRTSPPKVLIYNNSQTPRSPKTKKSLINSRSSARVPQTARPSSKNLNEFRRCRTKSPSPTFTRNVQKRFDSDDNNIGFKSMRKAKSATPPPRTFEQFSNAVLPMPKSEIIVPFNNNNLGKSHKSKISNKIVVENCSNFEHERFSSSTDKEKKIGHEHQINDEDDDNESCYEDEEYELNDDYIESSSDSEDGYSGHAFSRSEKSESPILPENQISIPSVPESVLVPSLFPNIPPYLSFATNLEKGPPVPPELHKVLKWKLSKVMPKVVRYTLVNSGCRVLKKTNEWMGTWGKHMKSPCFRTIRPYQKMNHLPGSFKIGRKDSCWKNLQKQVNRHGKKEFGFMPKTYIFPHDINILRKTWPKYQQRNIRWIIKPPASARGTGIRVVFAWSQIPKRKPLIVQRYIERPLLINGSKFDIRLYVLVTSINPLRVYMYKDGLARFASVKYSMKAETLHDRCMHLTNYSINKHSTNYAKNEDVNACDGHKWTLKSLMTYLSNTGTDISTLWVTMKNLVLRTLLAGEEGINNMVKINTGSRYNTFELFGFDILLDSNLVPWLLEVNISPSLHSDLPLDMHVKGPLVQAVLNTALYHVPPKLSSEKQKEICVKTGVKGPLCYDKRLYVTYLSRTEKIKHNQFTRKDLEDRDEYLDTILENLTPDDVRCLITSEDELARCLPLERVFPTNKTYKLLKYTESPRYYNRLLDAWEHRYSNNRNAGIKLLSELCETNYHLQVPPVPAQRDSNNEKNINNISLANDVANSNSDNIPNSKMGQQQQKQGNEIYMLGISKSCKDENNKKEIISTRETIRAKNFSNRLHQTQTTFKSRIRRNSNINNVINPIKITTSTVPNSIIIATPLTSLTPTIIERPKSYSFLYSKQQLQQQHQHHECEPSLISKGKLTKTS
ncbi:tubulin monoglutamylase TTLL4-like isoform X3 [Condylostylus longicornis]|nr:tubulin monoglutamylase TTLL4-like isoform X3 [Condylostylus longicornis]